jgi:predicted nucleotidyltransferase
VTTYENTGKEIGEMQLPEAWLEHIRQWAAPKLSIQEAWLFGSRATDGAEPDSDIDLAIVLRPPTRGHDWAYGAYQRFGDDWQNELKAMIGRHVNLELLPPADQDIGSRILLWKRQAANGAGSANVPSLVKFNKDR